MELVLLVKYCASDFCITTPAVSVLGVLIVSNMRQLYVQYYYHVTYLHYLEIRTEAQDT